MTPATDGLRPFLILYLACAAAARFRYRGHTLEEDAYRLAGSRRSRFESAVRKASAAEIEGIAADSLVPASGLRFWRQLAASTPLVGRLVSAGRLRLAALLGWPLAVPWLLLWTAAGAVLWSARLLVESVGALAAGSLSGLGFCLAALPRRPRFRSR